MCSGICYHYLGVLAASNQRMCFQAVTASAISGCPGSCILPELMPAFSLSLDQDWTQSSRAHASGLDYKLQNSVLRLFGDAKLSYARVKH
jgi:hypothetical protein